MRSLVRFNDNLFVVFSTSEPYDSVDSGVNPDDNDETVLQSDREEPASVDQVGSHVLVTVLVQKVLNFVDT